MRYVVAGLISAVLLTLWLVTQGEVSVTEQKANITTERASTAPASLSTPLESVKAQDAGVHANKKHLADFAPDQRTKAAIVVFQKGYPATKEEMASMRANYKEIMQARVAQAKAEREEKLAREKLNAAESLKNPFLEK